MKIRSAFLLIALGALASALAQPSPDSNRPGPWDQDVIVYRAAPDRPLEQLATFPRAGVPTVARLADGRLLAAHQHFPANDRAAFDKVAVHFSRDEGRTWTDAAVITVAGLPGGMRFPFDPTLVPLADGRVRLYFTGNFRRPGEPSTPAIHSAISADGVAYTYEPGVRFAVADRAVIDCAVALHAGVFHLFAPDNGAGPDPERPRTNAPAADRPHPSTGYHATSRDGLTFTRVADVTSTGDHRWLGNVQSDGDGLAFFGTGPGPWPLTSRDGITWTTATHALRIPGADPGAVRLRDGAWLLVVTGPPRAGTASAIQRRSPAGAPGDPGLRPMIHPLMAALDTNRDGLLDAEEIAGASAALRALDRNADGRLTPEELRPTPRP